MTCSIAVPQSLPQVGKVAKITSDPAEVIPHTDLFLVTVPAFAHQAYFEYVPLACSQAHSAHGIHVPLAQPRSSLR